MTTASKSNGLVIVIISGLVVVGAGAAGWFLFNDPTPPPATIEPAPAPTKERTPMTPSNNAAPRIDPEAKVEPTTEPAPPKERVTREYYVDGQLIRDHRPEGTPPMDLPPVIRPPDARRMSALSTSVITKSVRLVMRECVRSIPQEERTGDKPKMEAVIVVGVKDKTAKVTKATIQLRDVRGSATDAAKSCIENNVLKVTEGVDELDIESYDITTSFLF